MLYVYLYTSLPSSLVFAERSSLSCLIPVCLQDWLCHWVQFDCTVCCCGIEAFALLLIAAKQRGAEHLIVAQERIGGILMRKGLSGNVLDKRFFFFFSRRGLKWFICDSAAGCGEWLPGWHLVWPSQGGICVNVEASGEWRQCNWVRMAGVRVSTAATYTKGTSQPSCWGHAHNPHTDHCGNSLEGLIELLECRVSSSSLLSDSTMSPRPCVCQHAQLFAAWLWKARRVVADCWENLSNIPKWHNYSCINSNAFLPFQ